MVHVRVERPVESLACSGFGAGTDGSHTIAKLLVDHTGKSRTLLPEHMVLVIDEASMVDLLSAYRLVRMLPDAARVLWVGDEAQLPPVGPELVFHALMNTGIPTRRLSKVKRHTAHSDIYRVASALRAGHVPEIAALEHTPEVEVVHTRSLCPAHVEQVWAENGGAERTIILSPTRKGSGGVDGINKRLQRRVGEDWPRVYYRDRTRRWMPWIGAQGQSFHLGDRVMITQNNYETDVRNGDLGTTTDVWEESDEEGAGAVINIVERRIVLTAETLATLQLGYAITVHKAQGSQWPVCILMLPAHARHMVD